MSEARPVLLVSLYLERILYLLAHGAFILTFVKVDEWVRVVLFEV